MARAEALGEGGARGRAVAHLLARLRSPSSNAQDEVARVGLKGVAAIYGRTHDEAALQAIDDLQIDGGFADEVCGLYATLLRGGVVRTRYRGRGGTALRRCDGITFGEGELDDLLGATAPWPAPAERLGPR
jgi:hypothetical protein